MYEEPPGSEKFAALAHVTQKPVKSTKNAFYHYPKK